MSGGKFISAKVPLIREDDGFPWATEIFWGGRIVELADEMRPPVQEEAVLPQHSIILCST